MLSKQYFLLTSLSRIHGSSCYITSSRFLVAANGPPDDSKHPKHGSQYEYMTLQQPESSRHQAARSEKSGKSVVVRVGLLDLAKSKLYEAQTFYDEFSGMSEVKVAQNKVIEIQDQLQMVQDRRRHLLLELTLIRKQLQDIHVELQRATRGEHRYIELIKEEFDVMAREKEKSQIFQIVDQEERDLFAHLTSAVKTSHEKERTQANNVKYWSIIGSCVGALLGIIATSINYYYRNTQFETIRRLAGDSVDKLGDVDGKLLGLIKSVDFVKESIERARFEEQQRRQREEKERRHYGQASSSAEGWGSYLKRKTVGIYRYFIPNTTNKR
ncbi:uncharacterized protein LOC129756285 [Uranotaenia lowii]|uniref:uncharacterized protein LOC129756285 n=1 Tax=Uranotaenia lowii TaxID=190385 RepID=UPI0024787ACE|nr:uncharacterized protein LOC129756285 [Uranotaenia lowii]